MGIPADCETPFTYYKQAQDSLLWWELNRQVTHLPRSEIFAPEKT